MFQFLRRGTVSQNKTEKDWTARYILTYLKTFNLHINFPLFLISEELGYHDFEGF
jgi:hypothetical protein